MPRKLESRGAGEGRVDGCTLRAVLQDRLAVSVQDLVDQTEVSDLPMSHVSQISSPPRLTQSARGGDRSARAQSRDLGNTGTIIRYRDHCRTAKTARVILLRARESSSRLTTSGAAPRRREEGRRPRRRVRARARNHPGKSERLPQPDDSSILWVRASYSDPGQPVPCP